MDVMPAVSAGLDVQGVSKAYGGVRALSDVSLAIAPGEVHALVGENGAGKSTLIKIISGVVAPDTGTVQMGGTPVTPGNVAAAQRAGISTIHQESTAFPDLSAVDNLFVGREPVERGVATLGGVLLAKRRRRAETIEALAALGERIDVDRPLSELSLASRQMVAIARALSQRSRVLILDEPTASLSAPECEALFRAIGILRERGAGVLYVSHRLSEVFKLADRVTVLRDGRVVEHRSTSEFTQESLIRSMVGREIAALEPESNGTMSTGNAAPATPVLAVRELTREPVFRDVSLTVHAGEIVGLAGLVGAGRSEVARAIFGIDRRTSGEVVVDGVSLPVGSVQNAVRAGVALVPEDRQQLGLVAPLSVHDNLTLVVLRRLAKHGFRSSPREREIVGQLMSSLLVRAAGPDVAVDTLSGGNQQKIVVGKWLAMRPRVLLLDEPTRGVDVGAKAELYALIRSLAREGLATLVISSDLPEILALSDRVLVMRGGAVAGELTRGEATEERILSLAVPVGHPSVGPRPSRPSFHPSSTA